MKNIKLLLSLLITVTAASTYAATENFEIYNKAKTEITVTLKIGDKSNFPFRVSAGSFERRTIADNQPVYILIQEEPGISVNIFKKILPTDKTKYITFSPDKSPNVYPQTGPWMGFKGTTQSGLSLKNNIDKSYIQEGNITQHQ